MRNFNEEHVAMPVLPGYAETHIKLATHRILIISEDVNNKMAADIAALLLYFDNESHVDPIELYIHSNGGAATGLVHIYDVMQMITAPVKTFCMGKCYSAAAVLLAAGTKGERYALKNSSIMIHGLQTIFPIPGYDVTTSKNYFQFLETNNDSVMQILANHTGQTLDKVKADCREDLWLSPKQALEYGIIDHIVS